MQLNNAWSFGPLRSLAKPLEQQGSPPSYKVWAAIICPIYAIASRTYLPSYSNAAYTSN